MNTEISLNDLKGDDGAFRYRNLYLNSNIDEAKKIIGYKLKPLHEPNEHTIIFSIDTNFELFNYIGKPTFEFANNRLSIIKFTFNNQDDDIENLYKQLIGELIKLFSEASRSFNTSGENIFGNIQSEGYLWDVNNGNIRTSLQVVKIQGDKIGPSVTLSIGVIPFKEEQPE
ncbi:MAG: hypothetical protein HQ557_00625 [Bacteroidetes bacterium]|nr:hypothetical protein [Bacteroidota bacterium]